MSVRHRRGEPEGGEGGGDYIDGNMIAKGPSIIIYDIRGIEDKKKKKEEELTSVVRSKSVFVQVHTGRGEKREREKI